MYLCYFPFCKIYWASVCQLTNWNPPICAFNVYSGICKTGLNRTCIHVVVFSFTVNLISKYMHFKSSKKLVCIIGNNINILYLAH